MKTEVQLEVDAYIKENLTVSIICQEGDDYGRSYKELTVSIYLGKDLISEETTSI